MLHTDFINNVKVITIALVVVVMAGCGGGRATTSSSDQSGNGSDQSENGTGSATLTWHPPTTYTDTTPITELAGHNIYINDGSGFKKVASINTAGVTTYLVENLAAGSYTFVVTAFDTLGMESAFSAEANITI